MKRFMKDPIYYGSIALTWIILCCYAFGVAYTQADELNPDDVNQSAEICIATYFIMVEHYHLVDGVNPDEESVTVMREQYNWWIGFHSGFNNISLRSTINAAADEAQQLESELKEDRFDPEGVWFDIAMIGYKCFDLREKIDELTK